MMVGGFGLMGGTTRRRVRADAARVVWFSRSKIMNFN